MLENKRIGVLKESDSSHRSKVLKKDTQSSFPLQSLLNPLRNQSDEDSDALSSEISESSEDGLLIGLNASTKMNEPHETKETSESKESNESTKPNKPNEPNVINQPNHPNEPNEPNVINQPNQPTQPDEPLDSDESSSSLEEIATPLAVRSEKTLNKQDWEASQNRTMLSRSFNSSCVRYSLKKNYVCLLNNKKQQV